MFQRAMNYFTHAAEAGNANAMAFLGKVKITIIEKEIFRQTSVNKKSN